MHQNVRVFEAGRWGVTAIGKQPAQPHRRVRILRNGEFGLSLFLGSSLPPMSDDEFDYEEEIDDEGAEYVYNRNQDRAAPVDLDKLVRPAAQRRATTNSSSSCQRGCGLRITSSAGAQLDDLKSSTDVVLTQSKNGVQVSVAATSRAMNGAGLEIRFEVDDCYPRKRPAFDLLPPRGLKIRDVRHVGPLVEETIARLGGTPVVGKVVGVLRQWLNDESFRQQLEEAEGACAESRSRRRRAERRGH